MLDLLWSFCNVCRYQIIPYAPEINIMGICQLYLNKKVRYPRFCSRPAISEFAFLTRSTSDSHESLRHTCREDFRRKKGRRVFFEGKKGGRTFFLSFRRSNHWERMISVHSVRPLLWPQRYSAETSPVWSRVCSSLSCHKPPVSLAGLEAELPWAEWKLAEAGFSR